MISKPVENIVKADIDALLANKVSEGKSIDYKLTLPGGKDDDKKEFLADVSSFANAAGGDLVFGVSEAAGVPDALPGLAVADMDAEILRLEGIIREGIDPRLPGVQLKKIDGFVSGPVLVLRVPQSWASPHMVTFKNTSRFFTRSSAGKYQMDVGEIRVAFAASESLAERLQRFRTDRLSKIIAGETPVPLPDGSKIVLHIQPFSSFMLGAQADPSLLRRFGAQLQPLSSSGWSSRHNLDGFVTFSPSSKQSSASGGYCQLFRSGAIEAVDTDVFLQQNGTHFLAGEAYERRLIDGARSYLQGLQGSGVQPPLLMTLSMTGVRGVEMAADFRLHRFQPTPIDRDVILLPEVLIEEYPTSVAHTMRPIFDAVWNAAGYERSLNYDDKGNWKPK